MLVKKDRGRPIDPKARPKAFGETTIASDVAGAELLDEEMSPEGGSDDESDAFDSDDEEVLPSASGTRQSLEKLDASEDHKGEDEISGEQDDAEELDEDDDSDEDMDELDDDSDMDGDTDVSDEDDDAELNEDSENEDSDQEVEDGDEEDKSKGSGSKVQKRKLSDYIGQLDAADASLRALKKLAGAKKAEASTTDEAGRIFGDDDFKRIKELKVCAFQIVSLLLLYIHSVAVKLVIQA